MYFFACKITVLFLLLLTGTNLALATNLSTCLDGRYPTLCDKTVLTSVQLQQVARAEHEQNYKMCLNGRYPALCRHGELTDNESQQVRVAEHRENLALCMQGKYPALCRHGELAGSEQSAVLQAEKTANFATCLKGYKGLCRHELLTRPQAKHVLKAEAARDDTAPLTAPARPRARGGCESGHWVEAVMDDGGIVKLEDGSLWEISGGDTVDTALWLPASEITVCDDKLINTDDNETVDAIRIR